MNDLDLKIDVLNEIFHLKTFGKEHMITLISFPYLSVFLDFMSITAQGLNAFFLKCVELLKSVYSQEGTTHCCCC